MGIAVFRGQQVYVEFTPPVDGDSCGAWEELDVDGDVKAITALVRAGVTRARWNAAAPQVRSVALAALGLRSRVDDALRDLLMEDDATAARAGEYVDRLVQREPSQEVSTGYPHLRDRSDREMLARRILADIAPVVREANRSTRHDPASRDDAWAGEFAAKVNEKLQGWGLGPACTTEDLFKLTDGDAPGLVAARIAARTMDVSADALRRRAAWRRA